MSKMKTVSFLSLTICLCVLPIRSEIYVSAARGDNRNPGSADQPVKEIDRAISLAKAGERILIAGGHYMGTFGIGYMELDKAIRLIGSYDEKFTSRSIQATPTLFQPDNAAGGKARKALLRFMRDIDGSLIDGIVFDMGQRNAYSASEGLVDGLDSGRLLRSSERPKSGNSTVEEPIIAIASAAQGGDMTIQNCVFVNGASFAVQGGLRQGKLRLLNNVFIANRMAAIEIYGTCAGGGPGKQVDCGQVEIGYNTILFTWSRLKDMLDMGYGVRIMSKCSYTIHHNIIGASILAGIDHTRFTPNDWLRIDDNLFFANKRGDVEYSPASNTKLNIRVDQFPDLALASIRDNHQEIPGKLPLNISYLQAFLAASYSEQVDFAPDSPANVLREVMGLNKQGKIASKASMFMNRYPWRETLRLFGAVKACGAQSF